MKGFHRDVAFDESLAAQDIRRGDATHHTSLDFVSETSNRRRNCFYATTGLDLTSPKRIPSLVLTRVAPQAISAAPLRPRVINGQGVPGSPGTIFGGAGGSGEGTAADSKVSIGNMLRLK